MWQAISFTFFFQTMLLGVKGQRQGQGGRPWRPGLSTVKPFTLTTRHYDPNYGYKQYWPGGDWIINETEEKKKTTKPTLSTPQLVCGQECPEAYQKIGEVCTRDSLAVDPLMRVYKTFPSYCRFLNVVDPGCRMRKWWGLVFVHVGPCLPVGPTGYKYYSWKNSMKRKKTLVEDLYPVFKLKYSKEPFENVYEIRDQKKRPQHPGIKPE